MKNIALACILILAFGCNSKKSTHVVNDTQTPRVLYVLNAKSGTYENEKLKLEDVHSVIYFSDRPNRLAGHMSLKQFAKQWREEKEDPPNGALSILENSDDSVVELSDPDVENTTITFDIKLIKGKIPQKFESSALFIDLDSPSNQYFSYENFREDFHALDCSCAESAKNSSQ
ncbi:MAG: hypothetical protein K940chlam6_01369 [Chlamydiae bacterium]|nr:hypothetical protein [Chlamydiota bacterium]